MMKRSIKNIAIRFIYQYFFMDQFLMMFISEEERVQCSIGK